ncbi:TetR/AcrR family transcriptional regulator C-terminal domain-containing protein [Ornithinimicrobium sp. Arc0846-15]|nr:TetR/AcrR family transcriptional regulator C-terminal domain-containing protein [Ornithinimicrobium laminariae]
MTSPQTSSTDSPRRRLDRPYIVQSAMSSIDEHGVQALTMRRLGKELGVEAMSLYRYVSGREDLLEAVVEALLDGITDRIDAQEPTSWQNYLQLLAHEIRKTALAHPAVFPLAASRHPAAPWLRPPLRSIDLVEHFLASLTERGFDDTHAVDAYKVFTGFLVGSLLLEAAIRGGDVAPRSETLNEGQAAVAETDGGLALDDAPLVRRMQHRLSDDTSDQEFEIGLESLIDRIEQSVSR